MGAPTSLPGTALALALALLLGASAWPSPAASGSVECPSSAWISFGKSCYLLLLGPLETHSIDDAREYCKGNASGADIISINNKEENTFIQNSFHTHWHGPEYISLGMFFDTDDDTFKWYDKSKVNFTNWMNEESNEELLNTCATMHTTSGGWEKTTCEDLPLTQILCETAILYEKEYLLEKAWTTTLVITSTIVVAVSAAFLWFLYQRRVSYGTRCIVHNPAVQVSSNSDEEVLIEEENEYTA
ncbi:CD302 antigen [Sceloporus undulatus]|uniref:CD302 antigen n=1 Tax=Sceloporus undulatus TaxID=8520 RepID=UPI001C4C8D46|nr:CD302 antigen [Sceloporus undulatus]